MSGSSDREFELIKINTNNLVGKFICLSHITINQSNLIQTC